MVLPCPRCGVLHVDAPEPETGWTNPPHRSHRCGACQTVWRPADVATVGVEKVETAGSADTWKPGDHVFEASEAFADELIQCTATRLPACPSLPIGSRCAACKRRVVLVDVLRLWAVEQARLRDVDRRRQTAYENACAAIVRKDARLAVLEAVGGAAARFAAVLDEFGDMGWEPGEREVLLARELRTALADTGLVAQ